ncbi:Cysteine--tRNA ligase [Nitrospira sp. KM1]|uniref:cysteine--tRNA ligase n=1 Tax=Nitrospira sp. KM1 TaxID=1936990 RepID=UPI0013A71E54|nr:cysteine--tRNA ligase [Nitrospira sp. KM1]BCA54985.1 Cysteine--tRNA ligase [Nitrospira sp. KM1]
MLKLFNTLTGVKEPFESLEPKHVRMYVCGVTVYDYCHVGHARSALVFEVLRRHLERSGYAVTFVKNFTDVDDKIIGRAQQLEVSWEELTSKYIDAYHDDMHRLGIAHASREPKATDHMQDIVSLTDTLVRKGFAYQLNGDVYFQVDAYPAYGRLSKRRPEDLQAGARVEIDERKRHPMDFALWKHRKPGEPSWPSPWGPGRPGWHIECSAMSIKHLGETFDIHGGGMDLIFPHHENEIAQSCAATGKEFARYWVHNGFVQVNREKMSKSLGNFFTIREIFEKSNWSDFVTGEILRYFLLSTHYHSPLEFSDQGLHDAKQALDGFYDLFARLAEPGPASPQSEGRLLEALNDTGRSFDNGMDNDLNTPVALAELQMLRSEVNKSLSEGLSTQERRRARDAFRSLGAVLGLFQADGWEYTGKARSGSEEQSVAEIEAQIAERAEAKRRKDFKRADQIRHELSARGIILEDRSDGTSRWKR